MRVRFVVTTEVAGHEYAAGASVWMDGPLARRLVVAGLAVPVGPHPATVAPSVAVRHGDPGIGRGDVAHAG